MAYLFKYYAGTYDRFMNKFKLDRNNEILESIGDIQDKNILDIGGGTGTLADLLQRNGAKVTLVDPERAMTTKAKEKNPNLIIYSDTLQNLEGKLDEGFFDMVIIRDALHHIKQPREIIVLSHRYLKDKGQLIIWEFNIQALKSKLIWCFETLCFERCHTFTPKKLMALCEEHFVVKNFQEIQKAEMLYVGEKR